MGAVIYNAGIYLEEVRGTTPEGYAKVLAVNTLAPYMLTAFIERPKRLIYLSSGMHRSAGGSPRDLDWVERRWATEVLDADFQDQLIAKLAELTGIALY